MTRKNCILWALSGLMLPITLGIALAPSPAPAAELNMDTLLGIDQPGCCHVIDLLVHNRARRLRGHATPAGIDVLGGQPGDLELLCVNLVCDGAPGQGPRFHISMRNNSRWAVHRFQVSVVGVLERITPHSPCRSLRVDCIGAGETKCIEIQLPARCMSMGPHGGQLLPFDTLVVAIDSFDELVECNELNNVAVLPRGQIEPAAVESAGAAAPATAPAGPSTTNPGAAPAPGGAAPEGAAPGGLAPEGSAPQGSSKPSQIEKIDLDELDLGDL
jgi:hypothetical protein